MDKGRINLIPVYNINALKNIWGRCIEGVESILEYSTGDTSMAKVLNELLGGLALLWIGYVEEKDCGFIITKMVDVPFATKTLWITEVYIKPDVSREIFFTGLDKIKEFAKKNGCIQMKFYTVRKKGFLHKLESLGWKEGYQEIIYNLGG